MGFRYVRSIYLISLATVLVAGSGCFKNPGDPQNPLMGTNVPITPVYNSVNDSYLWAQGSCTGAQAVQFTYWSSLTTKKTVEGTCINGALSTHLDVDSGNQSQSFTVQMVARTKNLKSKTVTVTVNYTPTPPSSPGFAIVSAGGFATDGTNISTNSTVGETVSPNTLTGASISSRTGLQGVLDP